MLLGEPPRSQADLNFAIFGIPVRIHPFFWLVAVLLGARSDSAAELLSWVVALFVSILLHELGHALALRAYGVRAWVTLYGLGGVASYNPAEAAYAKGSGSLRQIVVSLAGPGAGFLLAAAICGAIILSGHQVRLAGIFVVPVGDIGSPVFTYFVFQMLFINIVWGLVNLMPVYPLDGGHIAREVLVAINPREGIRHSLILSIMTGGALAIFGLLQWKSVFVALLFGYLAYTSYTTLQAYTGRRGPW